MRASDAEIYKALFGLSQAIAGHTDLETLCNSVADWLRPVISFDYLALVLYDRAHDNLRLHAVSADRPIDRRERVVAVDGELAGSVVWRSQKPMVISPIEETALPGDIGREAKDAGIRAMVLLPLSNADHRLGILVFGFTELFHPDEAALSFLQRVTSELAVSVEGYLNRQALLLERDRTRVLFEVTNALFSKLPLEDLIPAISAQLSRVVTHDVVFVGLLDRSTGDVHLTGLHSPSGMGVETDSDSARPNGLPIGEALETGRPVVATGIDFERFPSPLYRKYIGLGVRSSCAVPMIGPNGTLGVLDLVRMSEDPFTNEEVDLLVQVANQIAIATENALAYAELTRLKDKLATEKLYLEDEINVEKNFGNMIGESPAFQAVLGSIQVVAPTDATVLIEGETGTGKELVARALHDHSNRRNGSFIKVNCAAIPPTLLESELFGHEKGSFTGAFAQKIGRFELAHQGTLFLDEIGEIPLELQSKLLRAIQEQELERLGGTRTIRVDVRFIAATNRSLKQMVDEGKFRSDLYYRLHVFPLKVPPLRERREDIPLLIRYFTQRYAKRLNRRIESIPSSVIDALSKYNWPGNIRELQNLIERSVILTQGPVLQVALHELPNDTVVASAQTRRVEDSIERERILHALQESHGKVSGPDGAAARLGLRRTTLQSRMKRLNIERRYK